ncbi:MAG: hypothetical protein [Caudoviricetes sp.]|nr:MAG: hypothetical protein [Caudoviricetes sp.]
MEKAVDECYGLNWVGKRDAYKVSLEPTSRTLSPDRNESVDFDRTGNLFIEGDNLEALKILQESYSGKVRMIYIDPPYNTGKKSFVYSDCFRENSVRKKNRKGGRRHHDNWLNMMMPRLYLARNLLRDDGVIFISIDDNEVYNLRLLMDEIFGEENFVANIIWARKRGKDNSTKFFSRSHEYLLVYGKNKPKLTINRLDMPESTRKSYTNPTNDLRGDYRKLGVWARGTRKGSRYSYTTRNGVFLSEREWLISLETMKRLDKENKLILNGDKVYKKFFLTEYKGDIPETIWDNSSNTANAADEIKNIMGVQIFETVKPIPYISKIVKIACPDKDSIILDFFAGSGTTAHAVMQLNAEDGGHRKCISVQLPEICNEKSKAFKAGYKTIADIAKERIRRAGKKIKEDNKDKENIDQLDIGFKVLKVSDSNFKEWRTDISSEKLDE